jgi:hypothetical protein
MYMFKQFRNISHVQNFGKQSVTDRLFGTFGRRFHNISYVLTKDVFRLSLIIQTSNCKLVKHTDLSRQVVKTWPNYYRVVSSSCIGRTLSRIVPGMFLCWVYLWLYHTDMSSSPPFKGESYHIDGPHIVNHDLHDTCCQMGAPHSSPLCTLKVNQM